MKQFYFDETYILTCDLADENKKDTTVIDLIDKENDTDYRFYH